MHIVVLVVPKRGGASAETLLRHTPLWGVVIAQNFRHVEKGAAPANPPYHTLLRSLKHTICDRFEDWQIVELVGVVLVVVVAPGTHRCRTLCGGSLNLGACPQWGGFH